MSDITSTELGATGRYIDLGSPASLDDLGAMTIMAYARPTGSGGGGFGYFYGKTPTGSVSGHRFFIDHNSGNPRLSFGTHSTGRASNPTDVGGTGGVTYDSWAHFEVTFDGTVSASGIRLYIDGTLTTGATNNGAGSIASDASNPVFLMNRFGLGREFVGDVAWIAQWDRVLDSTERSTVRSGGPLDVPSGLVFVWANQADLGPNALSPSARSTYAAGALPSNLNLGGAPRLSSATGTKTGSTTATGTVVSDEGNGTLYYYASTNASESVATIKASGASQAVSATGTQNVSFSGLTPSTVYYAHYAQTDTDTNDSTAVSSTSFTTDAGGGGDTTAPILTGASGTTTGQTTADLSVTTDEGNGTLYAVVTASATAPSAAQVKAGQDHTGSAAAYGSSQAISTTGAKSFSATGLGIGTLYYAHFMHEDAATNQSTVVSSAAFTTHRKGVQITLYDGATAQASLTGLTAVWWDGTTPHTFAAPDFASNSETTDGSGVLELDLSADTALAIGAYGCLLVYKVDGMDVRDSLAFFGQVQVQDIA